MIFKDFGYIFVFWVKFLKVLVKKFDGLVKNFDDF